AEYLMPHHLTTFRAAHPDIGIGLSVENSATVIDRVRRQSCDLGLIESVSLPAGMRAAVVGRDRLMIACAPSFAASWTKPITAEAPVVLSELALRDDFRAGRLLPLPVDDSVDLSRELHAVWSPKRRLSSGASMLLEHMISTLG